MRSLISIGPSLSLDPLAALVRGACAHIDRDIEESERIVFSALEIAEASRASSDPLVAEVRASGDALQLRIRATERDVRPGEPPRIGLIGFTSVVRVGTWVEAVSVPEGA